MTAEENYETSDAMAHLQIATVAGIDKYGFSYDSGDHIVTFADGSVACIPNNPEYEVLNHV